MRGEVDDIRFDYVSNFSETDKLFTVKTKEGSVFHSRSVVLATGPGNEKNYPWKLSPDEEKGATHIFDIKIIPNPTVKERIRSHSETNVLIVGGGLTSAQISDILIRKGVTKVWLLMRSGLKSKTSLTMEKVIVANSKV